MRSQRTNIWSTPDIIRSDCEPGSGLIDRKETEGGVDDPDGGDAVVSAGEAELREAAVVWTIFSPEWIADRSDGVATTVELGCAVVKP